MFQPAVRVVFKPSVPLLGCFTALNHLRKNFKPVTPLRTAGDINFQVLHWWKTGSTAQEFLKESHFRFPEKITLPRWVYEHQFRRYPPYPTFRNVFLKHLNHSRINHQNPRPVLSHHGHSSHAYSHKHASSFSNVSLDCLQKMSSAKGQERHQPERVHIHFTLLIFLGNMVFCSLLAIILYVPPLLSSTNSFTFPWLPSPLHHIGSVFPLQCNRHVHHYIRMHISLSNFSKSGKNPIRASVCTI